MFDLFLEKSTMACPFSRNRKPSLAEVKSIVEEEASEPDSLTLKHLNAAIQLLTAPSVSSASMKNDFE